MRPPAPIVRFSPWASHSSAHWVRSRRRRSTRESRRVRGIRRHSADTTTALTRMGYHVVPLEVWGTGNAAEAIGIAPADAAAAKELGFPRPATLYGASDARAPAGSAATP